MTMRDPEKTIGGIIDKANVVMLSSVDEDGYPNTKAMLPPREREGIKVIYLTTNTSSMRVRQYRVNPKACIYFCDKRFFRGVMLKGSIEVCEDAASKRMIWREGDETYYPQGVDDPDYCVLKFTGFEGRYYSNFTSETFAVI
jgi:general stress protein 26